MRGVIAVVVALSVWAQIDLAHSSSKCRYCEDVPRGRGGRSGALRVPGEDTALSPIWTALTGKTSTANNGAFAKFCAEACGYGKPAKHTEGSVGYGTGDTALGSGRGNLIRRKRDCPDDFYQQFEVRYNRNLELGEGDLDSDAVDPTYPIAFEDFDEDDPSARLSTQEAQPRGVVERPCNRTSQGKDSVAGVLDVVGQLTGQVLESVRCLVRDEMKRSEGTAQDDGREGRGDSGRWFLELQQHNYFSQVPPAAQSPQSGTGSNLADSAGNLGSSFRTWEKPPRLGAQEEPKGGWGGGSPASSATTKDQKLVHRADGPGWKVDPKRTEYDQGSTVAYPFPIFRKYGGYPATRYPISPNSFPGRCPDSSVRYEMFLPYPNSRYQYPLLLPDATPHPSVYDPHRPMVDAPATSFLPYGSHPLLPPNGYVPAYHLTLPPNYPPHERRLLPSDLQPELRASAFASTSGFFPFANFANNPLLALASTDYPSAIAIASPENLATTSAADFGSAIAISTPEHPAVVAISDPQSGQTTVYGPPDSAVLVSYPGKEPYAIAASFSERPPATDAPPVGQPVTVVAPPDKPLPVAVATSSAQPPTTAAVSTERPVTTAATPSESSAAAAAAAAAPTERPPATTTAPGQPASPPEQPSTTTPAPPPGQPSGLPGFPTAPPYATTVPPIEQPVTTTAPSPPQQLPTTTVAPVEALGRPVVSPGPPPSAVPSSEQAAAAAASPSVQPTSTTVSPPVEPSTNSSSTSGQQSNSTASAAVSPSVQPATAVASQSTEPPVTTPAPPSVQPAPTVASPEQAPIATNASAPLQPSEFPTVLPSNTTTPPTVQPVPAASSPGQPSPPVQLTETPPMNEQSNPDSVSQQNGGNDQPKPPPTFGNATQPGKITGGGAEQNKTSDVAASVLREANATEAADRTIRVGTGGLSIDFNSLPEEAKLLFVLLESLRAIRS